MPLTALDRLLPFQPHALFAYLSLWVYVGFGPGLQRTYTDLFVYGLWMGALCLTGLTLLYFWPTEVPPRGLDVSGLPGIALLRRVDAVGNACPSMHVAAATFTAIRVHEVRRRAHSPLWLRMLNWTWCVAIVYSTLAIRQHVALDVVAARSARRGVRVALDGAHDPVRISRRRFRVRWRPREPREGDANRTLSDRSQRLTPPFDGERQRGSQLRSEPHRFGRCGQDLL